MSNIHRIRNYRPMNPRVPFTQLPQLSIRELSCYHFCVPLTSFPFHQILLKQIRGIILMVWNNILKQFFNRLWWLANSAITTLQLLLMSNNNWVPFENTFSFFNVEIFWEKFLAYIYIYWKFPQYSRHIEYCTSSLLWFVYLWSVTNYFV